MRTKSKEVFTQQCDKLEGWAKAISEAERQIAEAEAKIHGLKLSIQTFQHMQRKGESFPGSEDKLQIEVA